MPATAEAPRSEAFLPTQFNAGEEPLCEAEPLCQELPVKTVDLSGDLGLPTPTPKVYKTEHWFTASLKRKGTANPGNGLYPRDGSATVSEIEESISELTIPGQELNVITGSGMAALTACIWFGLEREGMEHASTRQRPTYFYSQDLYTQARITSDRLKWTGVATRAFDLTEQEPLQIVDTAQSPAVVLAETVANTASMPVLDVHGLLAKTRALGERAPLVILDNTLPLLTGLDIGSLLKPDDKVLVVESATKSAMHNSEHLGVVYSANQELIEEFRRYKARVGFVTSTGADPSILRAIEASKPTYHERNRALYASTGKIAVALAEAQKELGDKPEFTVSFPTLAGHPDQPYVAEHYPDGVSPVVFMECSRFDEGVAKVLLQRLVKHPRIREQIKEGQIFMGQSFGFKEARFLYDLNAPQVRVAGGYGIDSEALAEALKEAAADV